ncbi:MAG: hypothetical protein RL139_1557, partial [Gemmatimonadota bacterium]
MTSRARTVLLFAGALLLVLAAAILGRERGLREGASQAQETLARVQSTEAALAEAQTQTASLAAARRVAEDRAEIAEALVESAEAERDQVLASVRAPMTDITRAKRVNDALGAASGRRGTLEPVMTAGPNPVPMFHNPVRPLVLDGVPGMWVEASAFEQLHEALELRPVLERQVAALTEAHAAQRLRADLAVAELAVVAHERDVLRIAWADAETDLAEARADAPLPAWVTWGAPAAIVAAAVVGAAVGRATADGVTV